MNKQRNTYQFIKWLSNLPESDLSVPNGEPFQMEIATIVESVKSGEVLPPLCSGKDALVTLEALKEALAFKGG
jgi:hypothetical protein